MRRVRGCLRVAVALWTFARRYCPKWLLPVLAVCLAIPGPFDELIALGVVLVPVLRSRAARQELRAGVVQAWQGPLSELTFTQACVTLVLSDSREEQRKMPGFEVTTSVTKLSWRRDPSVPAGQPALGRFDCPCGHRIEGVAFGDGSEHPCQCGRVYDSRGWVVRGAQ